MATTQYKFVQTKKFGVDKTAVVAQTKIVDPTGGATIDTQSRAAIVSILDLLEAFGLMKAS